MAINNLGLKKILKTIRRDPQLRGKLKKVMVVAVYFAELTNDPPD